MMQNAYTDWLLCLAWVKKESAVLRGATLSGAYADWWCKKISQWRNAMRKISHTMQKCLFPKDNLKLLFLCFQSQFFGPLPCSFIPLSVIHSRENNFFCFWSKDISCKIVWGLILGVDVDYEGGDADCLWGWCSLPWSGSECLVWYWMLVQNIRSIFYRLYH